MAIVVTFGTYDGEPEVVDKDGLITWDEDGTDCILVNTDLIHPVLKVDSNKRNKTYVEIPFFGRKYFVDGIEGIVGGHCILRCTVDVLYSFKSGVLGLNCFVQRNEDIERWKRDEVDRAIIVSNRRVIYGEPFGDELVRDQCEYILGTIGEIL